MVGVDRPLPVSLAGRSEPSHLQDAVHVGCEAQRKVIKGDHGPGNQWRVFSKQSKVGLGQDFNQGVCDCPYVSMSGWYCKQVSSIAECVFHMQADQYASALSCRKIPQPGTVTDPSDHLLF